MKPGDLVKHTDRDTLPRWLYHGDDEIVYSFGGSEVTFEFNDAGIVLLVKKLVPGKHKKHILKF
jgi:hypothetical protein